VIGHRITNEPVKRVTERLSELADDIAMVESLAHSCAVRTDDGLVVADTSGVRTGRPVFKALRGWSDERVHTILYRGRIPQPP
jgi:hypothetical protein